MRKLLISLALTFLSPFASAYNQSCSSGPITGHVSYNVPYYIIGYTAADFIYGTNIIFYVLMESSTVPDTDNSGGGSMNPAGGNAGFYITDPPDATYDIQGELDIGWPGFPFISNIHDTCRQIRSVSNPPTINFSPPSAITIGDDFTFSTSASHAFKSPTNYRIEIRRNNVTSYTVLSNGLSTSYSSYAKSAGWFFARAAVTVNGSTYVTPEKPVEVRFPTFSQIIAVPQNQTAALNAWTQTMALLTPSTRQEMGAWVRYNTATRTYEYTTLTPGPVTSNFGSPPPAASVDPFPPKPADTPSGPTLFTQTATYTVASFHVHTAGTNLTNYHCVSGLPSEEDNHFDNVQNVTGLVYSFDADSCTGSNWATAAKSFKKSGPDRRSTQ